MKTIVVRIPSRGFARALVIASAALCVAPACSSSSSKSSATAQDGGGAGTAGSTAHHESGSNGNAGTTASALPHCEGGTPDAHGCVACIPQGRVQGKVTGTTCEYLGIPYAKPPVGDLRFAPPERAEGWSETRDATAFGKACVQSSGMGAVLTGGAATDEDCLYINVWTPTDAPNETLPVMVFVHGGGYTGGATNTYIGLDLAQKGPAVVVDMNYRLGALGFFAHPDLDKQRPDKPSGSDAIRDQQLALQWVKDNVQIFHGDPANVTLFGESAGSSSVGVHVVSPGSTGLAKRFIMESGVSTHGVGGGIEPVSRDTMYQLTKRMTDDLCPGASDVIACMRGLPADRIQRWMPSSGGDAGASGAPTLRWVPVVEGTGGVLPDTPEALMQAGRFNPGPIIVGTNKNEYGLFQLLGGNGSVSTAADMRSRVQAQYADKTDQIMALYAPNDSVDANQAFITYMTDVMFRCQTRHFARLAAAAGRDVYLYSFEQGNAYHSEELEYVFGGPMYFTIGLNTSPVPALIDVIQGYWFNFARTGDPNGKDLVAWPKYDMLSDQNIALVDPTSVSSGHRKEACDFWDSYLQSQ